MIFGHEWLHVLRAAVVDRDRENLDLLTLEIGEGPLHGGHLCLTDRSPCGPESQEQHVPQKIARMDRVALEICQAERRHRLAFLYCSQTTWKLATGRRCFPCRVVGGFHTNRSR